MSEERTPGNPEALENPTPTELAAIKAKAMLDRPEDFIDKNDLIIAVDTKQRLFLGEVTSSPLKLAWATINWKVIETLMLMGARVKAKEQVDKRIITPGNN